MPWHTIMQPLQTHGYTHEIHRLPNINGYIKIIYYGKQCKNLHRTVYIILQYMMKSEKITIFQICCKQNVVLTKPVKTAIYGENYKS